MSEFKFSTADELEKKVFPKSPVKIVKQVSNIHVTSEVTGNNGDTTVISFDPDQGDPQRVEIVGNFEWAEFVELVNFVDRLRRP